MRYVLIVIILLLTIFGIGSYKIFSNVAPKKEPRNISTTTADTIHERTWVPPGRQEYSNKKYQFSLSHPENLRIMEFDEGGGAMTVTFQNEAEGKGLQIFIVPYTGGQVSEDQFKQDVPSGVRNDLKEVTIDGATGASFYSTNALLGETAEIWFIHGGYLFEVTSLKPLDEWLDTIMETWQFI
jgi:hypothetical protein